MSNMVAYQNTITTKESGTQAVNVGKCYILICFHYLLIFTLFECQLGGNIGQV